MWYETCLLIGVTVMWALWTTGTVVRYRYERKWPCGMDWFWLLSLPVLLLFLWSDKLGLR